ncbi:MAG TPA: acetyl-CoA carboxylase [Bradyrhizobium sp.]|jgi:biotin carboxyl carrier protein|nr:acetyl-CoA carboxylase [Bradyrhizobium sp.]HTG04732.1 acetyl-CoA carboxylase [Bradyrhizobium sp.]
MANKQIVSPLPGTFYRRPTPETPPFKAEGDSIAAGDTIGLVEVMKSFHAIQAQFGGKIVKFLIDNEEPIMAGQPIADVED